MSKISEMPQQAPFLLLMQYIFLALALIGRILANTEVHLIKVPNYYNVPVSVDNRLESSVMRLNDSSLLLLHHPIVSIESSSSADSKVVIPYDFLLKPRQRLYVKINNYENSTYNANDLLHVKFCWPATTPISFNIDHEFLKNKEVYPKTPPLPISLPNQLEIYLVIDMEADFYAVSQITDKNFSAVLSIAKLPNSTIPIPLELYDFILYSMDLMILAIVALPHLLHMFQHLVNSE